MDKATLARMGVRRVTTLARAKLHLHAGLDWTVPESIHCELIERCNYKCQYCHFWQMDSYSAEMSTAQWRRALLEVKAFCGNQPVKFIGGEPFLRKDFLELAEFCLASGVPWGVTTNGSAFTTPVVARLVAAHPTNIDVSVDSPVADVHDLARGISGSLKKIETGLRRLRREKVLRGQSFPIRIKPTITRLNFRTLPKFAEWLPKVGADTVDFRPVHSVGFWTPSLRKTLWPDSQEIEELREVIEILIAQKQAGAPIETAVDVLRSFESQFMGRVVRPSSPGPCMVGARDLTIKANGDLSTCWEYPPIGNINDGSLRDLWRSQQGRRNRAETLACPRVGGDCANTCLDHRSLKEDLKRGWLLLRSTAGQ